MKIRNILLSVTAIAAVAACASRWDVEGVRATEARGSLFDKAMKHEYVEMADLERMRGDWDETENYLNRARVSALGQSPAPESPEARSIPTEVQTDLRAAHARLSRALDGGARVRMPEEAAWAQAGYECWAEALSENLFINRMEACKQKFENAMDLIDRPAMMGAAPTGMIPAMLNGKYVVFFGFGSTKVKSDGLAVLAEAAKAYQEENPERIVVGGHADTVGSDKVNLIVSRRRAENVSAVLNKHGVPRAKLMVKAYGESRLAIPTPDNVREPRNRRVTVDFENGMVTAGGEPYMPKAVKVKKAEPKMEAAPVAAPTPEGEGVETKPAQ